MSDQVIYLFTFATIIAFIYYLFPKSKRWIVLLIASLAFAFMMCGFMMLFIVASAILIYVVTHMIETRKKRITEQKEVLEKDIWKDYKKKVTKVNKRILIIGVILILAILFFLKYLNFALYNVSVIFNVYIKTFKWTLPLGISYYTLSGIGYMIDVYHNKCEAERNPFKVMLYISYFPMLLEGPISRFKEHMPQLIEGNKLEYSNVICGGERFLWGLFKKVVIADRLAILVSATFDSGVHGPSIILGVIAFTFQLYAEFSGIIDMVMGVSRVLGIKPEENFRQPFFSRSVGEFWRRWHISLGGWFKEYVFYPLSMSKPLMSLSKKIKAKAKDPFYISFITCGIALFVVWSLTGLWHGAAYKYLFYGIYYFIIMELEMLFEHLLREKEFRKKKWYHVLSVIRTFVLVCIGMFIFRADGLGTFAKMFINIFKSNNINILDSFDIKEAIVVILALIVLLVVSILKEKGKDPLALIQKHAVIHFIVMLLLVIVIWIFGAYGYGYETPDPIYGGF